MLRWALIRCWDATFARHRLVYRGHHAAAIALNGDITLEVVAGIVMNTAWYAAVQPTNPRTGPRWQAASTIPQRIAGDQFGGFVERHPKIDH